MMWHFHHLIVDDDNNIQMEKEIDQQQQFKHTLTLTLTHIEWESFLCFPPFKNQQKRWKVLSLGAALGTTPE